MYLAPHAQGNDEGELLGEIMRVRDEGAELRGENEGRGLWQVGACFVWPGGVEGLKGYVGVG